MLIHRLSQSANSRQEKGFWTQVKELEEMIGEQMCLL